MEIVKEYIVRPAVNHYKKVVLTKEGIYFIDNGNGAYEEISKTYFDKLQVRAKRDF